MVTVLALLAWPTQGHPLAPSLLRLEETSPEHFEVTWRVPPGRGRSADLRPLLPPHCTVVEAPSKAREHGEVVERWAVDCKHAEEALRGHTISTARLDPGRGEILIFLRLLDGRRLRGVLGPKAPTWKVPSRQNAFGVASTYAELGVEHILGGFDHLLFILGLVLLVPGRRSLLATVTGFTLGHSLTLALAALGLVRLPSAPVEIAIAASILWLAVELARGENTLLHRRPWALASAFGLLHGLGFAGALVEIGLPKGEIPLALAAFNLGIEGGQILFVVAALAVGFALRPLRSKLPDWAPALPCYFIGTMAAYWLYQRLAETL